MSNDLSSLNDVLFKQLDRLGDTDLSGEKLNEEIKRSKAVSDITKNIIDNGRLVLEAQKFKDDKWNANAELPEMLESGSGE